MIRAIERYLLENWEVLPMGRPRPRSLRLLGQTFSFDKPIFLVFVDDESSPFLVAKVPRSPRYNAARETEAAHLCEARRRGGAVTHLSVPEVVCVTRLGGYSVSVERYLPGRGLNSVLSERRLADPVIADETFTWAFDWLHDFQAETRPQNGSVDQTRTVCEAEFAAYVTHFAPSPAVRSGLNSLLAIEETPPSVFSHGQFSAENLLVDGDGSRIAVRVIDWDWSMPNGAPLVDIFRFAWIYQFRARGLEQSVEHLDDYLDAFDGLFFGDCPLTAPLRDQVARYCTAFQIDPRWTRTLLALALVTEANRKYRHLMERAIHGGYWYPLQGDPRVGELSYRDAIGRQLNAHLLEFVIADRRELAI